MTDADRAAFEKWWRSEVKERALAPSELHRKAWIAAIAYATSWKLPCDVRLPPVTTIRRGCDLSTLITGIRRREEYPEDQRVFPDREGTRVASVPIFRNDGHDLPDTRDTDCPYCHGSGHKDDVVDHKSENIDHKPEQSDFSAQVAAACAAFDRLSPDEQSAHRQRQRDSWVQGEEELSRLEREDALAAAIRARKGGENGDTVQS